MTAEITWASVTDGQFQSLGSIFAPIDGIPWLDR